MTVLQLAIVSAAVAGLVHGVAVAFGVRMAAVRLVAGATSRRPVLEIDGVTEADVRRVLQETHYA